MKPDVVIEATIAKRNIGVSMADAPLVIGVGPALPPEKTSIASLKQIADSRWPPGTVPDQPLPIRETPAL